MAGEWPIIRLGDYIDSSLGKMLDAQKNKGQLQPYLGNRNVRWGTFDLADLAQMKFEEHEEARYGIRDGDLIVCEGGEPGRCAVWREEVPNMKIQKALHRVRTKKGLNNYYLFYWFMLAGRTGKLEPYFTGTTIKHLTGRAVEALEIPLPPIEAQEEIARILKSLDDKIELNRRMNETLEAIARAMFKSWFVDFDPVRAKMSGEPPESICRRLGLTPDLLALFPDRLVDSELGEIPEGWSISTLAIEAEGCGGFIQTGPFGSQLHAADYVAEGVPVVMPQDLVNRRVSLARIVRVTHDMAKRLSRHALKAGDVVYSRRGDVERHALVSEREEGWLCGTGCLLVRLGDAWPSQAYLSEVLDLPVTREWLVRHAVGATMPNLNTSILGSVPFLRPPEPVLSVFEEIASPLRKQQIAASRESDSLALVRDALLPKLLSGELRVPIVEEAAA